MNEIATTTEERPMHQDEELVSLHRLLGQLRREEKTLRDGLETLDAQDVQHYDAPSDDPDAMQRQRTRLATDAALKQVLNRIKGAEGAVKRREGELIEAGVERVRVQANKVLDAMAHEARAANKALNDAVDAIRRIQSAGAGLVQAYRGVRGRSTLTAEGHIPGGQITAVANPDNIRFAVESHLSTYLDWRTDHGANGEFGVRMGGMIEDVRNAIELLLGHEAIRQAVAMDLPANESKG